MKKTMFLLAFALAACYQPERNCKDFKTGKFQFDYKVKGVTKTTIFERTDRLEIETYEGKTDTATIRWVNDCEYILQRKHPKNRQEEKAIDMKILTTSKNSYTFEFGDVGSSKTETGTVTKID
jgi:hypothetical protein